MLFAFIASVAVAQAQPAAKDCTLFPVERDGKTGYVDATDRVVIPAQFDGGSFFSEGLAPVRVDRKMGYIDCDGRWVLKPRFEWAQECREGWCRVADASYDDFALVDRDGNRFPIRRFSLPYAPREGMIVGIGSLHRYGFMSVDGKTVVGPRFKSANSEFSEGVLAACEAENRCGFVDRSGSWVIAPTYCRTSSFSEGLARVCAGGDDVSYIDHAGRRAFETPLKSGWDFKDGITAASPDEKRWGILDRKGEFVVAPTFDFLGLHRDGRMLFMRKSRWGVIDYSGHIVLDAVFDRAELLPGGVADVHLGNEHGYYDRDGHAIEPIRSLDAYRGIRRISLIALEGHEACRSFRVDLRADGSATLIAECRDRAHEAADAPPDPMRHSGRFISAGAADTFAVLAKFAADNDLAHYDDRNTGGALDTEYDHLEIETGSGVRSLEVAYGIAPSLRMMDWSVRQAVREIRWQRE